jgi:prefoldin subunit 5
MTDQQKHLQQVIEQQDQLIQEVNTLNTQVTTKRELIMKLQGVLEYLNQTGVTLPTSEDVAEENKEEEIVESPTEL